MGDETKRLRFIIKSNIGRNKPIPAVLVAETFQRLQNILYYIVDDLGGNPPRKAGDLPKSVKEKAELVVTGFHVGSAEAELTLSDSQACLSGAMTVGENALSIADTIVCKVSVGELFDISSIIKNKNRQNRIINVSDGHG